MTFEDAQQLCDSGSVVRRTVWPAGTVLVKSPTTEVPIGETRDILQKIAISQGWDKLIINPRYDLVAAGRLQANYQFERADVESTDWETVNIDGALPQQDQQSPLLSSVPEGGTEAGTTNETETQTETGDTSSDLTKQAEQE